MLKLKMKLQVILIFLIVFIGIISGCIEETPKEKKPMIIHVDINGGADFINIQNAIEQVSTGGIVFVKSGIYNESLIVNKSISLIGEDKDKTVISFMPVYNPHLNGIIFVNADNCNIEGLNISRKYFISGIAGIFINSTLNNITNNIINNYNYGIYINTNSEDNNISVNTILNTRHGIEVYGSDYNNISNNNISYSSGYGFYLRGSHSNIIKNNYLSNNNAGIRITSSNNNKIYDNIIINNKGGLRLCCSSKNNIIFKNTFIQNQEWNAIDDISNQWDNGIIGNYWDDYKEKYPNAKNSNGIWGTPYTITEDIVDRFPLVNPPYL